MDGRAPHPFFINQKRLDALNKERLESMKSKINELSLKLTVLEHFDKLATLLDVEDGDICAIRHKSLNPSKRLILNYKSNGGSTLSIVDLPKDSKTLDTLTFEELTDDKDILYHLATARKEIIDCGTSSTVYESLRWYEIKSNVRLLLEHRDESGYTSTFDVTDKITNEYTTVRVCADLDNSDDDGTCSFVIFEDTAPKGIRKQVGYYFSDDCNYSAGPFKYPDMLAKYRVGMSDELVSNFYISTYKDMLEHKSGIKEYEKMGCILKEKLLAALGFRFYLTDCPVLEAVK